METSPDFLLLLNRSYAAVGVKIIAPKINLPARVFGTKMINSHQTLSKLPNFMFILYFN